MPAIINLLENRSIDLLKPKPEDIFIEDIAGGLSKLCRFNGQIKDFYSLAQHSCICVDLARQSSIVDNKLLMAILLHDASEAYCGDVIKPLKNVIGKKYEFIEKRITRAIEKRFNVNIIDNKDTIKKFDVFIYNIEKKLKTNKDAIKCLSHSKAYRRFMKYFGELND